MEVSITQFRCYILALVNQAMDGKEVRVTHRGRRFKVVPEVKPGSRVTSLDVINPARPGKSLKRNNRSMQEEMVPAWERDWPTL